MEEGANLLYFLAPILDKIQDENQRDQASQVLTWVHETYPQLGVRIAWNQPMFTQDGTFILGFSYAQKHFSVAPEGEGIEHFAPLFDQLGISYGKKFFRIPWDTPVPYDLLAQVIDYNCTEKQGYTSFWR